MFRRFLHLSACNLNTKKQGVKLLKLLNPSSKRKWSPRLDTLPSVTSLTKVKREPGNKGIRRLAVLNKLFMKHITDIMSTGSRSIDVVGRGLEILRVSVSPDLQRLNVFWVCKNPSEENEMEKTLSNIAGGIRHELSTLRLLGQVPFIFFVKDKDESNLMELDRRLAKADYGEDYVPTDPGQVLKSEFSLETKLPTDIKEKIMKLEESTPIDEEPTPVMTNSVYGLDHQQMMNRMIASRKRITDSWNKMETEKFISKRAEKEQREDSWDSNDLMVFLRKRAMEDDEMYNKFRKASAGEKIEHEMGEAPYIDEMDDETDDDYDVDDFYSDDDEGLEEGLLTEKETTKIDKS